jgi:hypothetical protein
MTTGNPERDALLIRAIKETIAVHENPEEITFVADKLPADFDLSADELADALHEFKELSSPSAMGAMEEVVGDAPADVGLAAISSPQAVPGDASLSQTQAQALVEAAHNRLGAARVAVTVARQTLGDAKGKLALAITGWQTASEPGTPEQRRMAMVRDHLASEAARKQRLHDAGLKTARMNTSKYPAVNLATGQRGFKGNNRGAYPSNYQHRNVAKPGEFQGK